MSGWVSKLVGWTERERESKEPRKGSKESSSKEKKEKKKSLIW